MTTIELKLSEKLAKAAKEVGLLVVPELERIFRDAYAPGNASDFLAPVANSLPNRWS